VNVASELRGDLRYEIGISLVFGVDLLKVLSLHRFGWVFFVPKGLF
jgi:hypothetical protein